MCDDGPMEDRADALQRAIATFVAEVIAECPAAFTGGFSYRIDVHEVDGGVAPFIYTSDDAHTELWTLGGGSPPG